MKREAKYSRFSPTVPFYLEVTRNFMLHTQSVSGIWVFAIGMHTTPRRSDHNVSLGVVWPLQDRERFDI
jgi:hypothetical protein